MELTINELDDYPASNGTWQFPETEETNERAFSAQNYNPNDFQYAPSVYRGQNNQPPPPLKKEPLNYDDILLKLNVHIVNGVMRYIDPRKGFTFENAVAANHPQKSQIKAQIKPPPMTTEQHKECRIKQEMDRRRINQIKTTKMLIPNNNATISRPSAKSADKVAPSVNTPLAKAPVTKGSGMFKMKMGR